MVSDVEDDDESVFSDEDSPPQYFEYLGAFYNNDHYWPEADADFNLPEANDDDDDDDNSSGSRERSPVSIRDCLRIAEAVVDHGEEGDRQVVELEDGLWDALPFELLLFKILAWLPLAAHFRLRCVCKRWRSSLSSPEWLSHYAQVHPRLSCSVMGSMAAPPSWFFCKSERKWFELPLYPNNLNFEWELVDTDVGLVCYLRDWAGKSLLCVSNPLTKSSRVICPNYPPYLDERNKKCEVVKLHVDRQTKNFKVIVLLHCSSPPTTVMYNSTTNLWSDCNSYPPYIFERNMSLFVWNNIIYSRSFIFKPGAPILLTFDMESGLWNDVEIELPRSRVAKYYVINHKDSVLLILMQKFAENFMSVWKLRDEYSDFSRSSWIQIPVDAPSALKPLLTYFHTCVSLGDWIFFPVHCTTDWVKYTFATKSWRVMPSPDMKESEGRAEGRGTAEDEEEEKEEEEGEEDEALYREGRGLYRWFGWEPRLDVNA